MLAGTSLHISGYLTLAGRYSNGKEKYINQDLMHIKNVNYVDRNKELGNTTFNARTLMKK